MTLQNPYGGYSQNQGGGGQMWGVRQTRDKIRTGYTTCTTLGSHTRTSGNITPAIFEVLNTETK